MTTFDWQARKASSSLGSMPCRSRTGKGFRVSYPDVVHCPVQARMTVFSALAFLPVWAKFTLVPDFLRFAWWLVWVRVLVVAHVFHRAAVMQGGISFAVALNHMIVAAILTPCWSVSPGRSADFRAQACKTKLDGCIPSTSTRASRALALAHSALDMPRRMAHQS